MLIYKAIYASIAGCAAVAFAIMALGPTRAIREHLAVRLIALGGAITFGALTLESIGVASFKIVVAPVIVGGVVSSVGAMRSARTRGKAHMPTDDPDTTQR